MTTPTDTVGAFKRRNHGNGHSYRLGDRKVPGVTTIIGAGVPKGGLIGWAGTTVAEFVVDRLSVDDRGRVLADDLIRDLRAGAKYPIPAIMPGRGMPRSKLARELSFAPNRVRDTAAARGGKVHEYAEQLAAGKDVDVPDETLGYVDAYLDWREKWQPSEELLERPILNRSVFYAGTPDLVAVLGADSCAVCGSPDCDGMTLVDWKTGQGGIYGETALQVAAYANAEVYVDVDGVEQPMPGIRHTLGVWLRPDRTHETYPLDGGPATFRLFRYVYEVAKFLDGPKLFGTADDEEAPVVTAKGSPITPK
jgi:hypothetical protein